MAIEFGFIAPALALALALYLSLNQTREVLQSICYIRFARRGVGFRLFIQLPLMPPTLEPHQAQPY